MKRFLPLLLAGSFVLSACGASTTPTASSDPIKIGLIAPLTGDAASIGADILNGAQLAADEINAAGGIDGRQVVIVAEDGRCTGGDAASAAQKLVNVDKVTVILGGACSGETLAAAPIAEAAKVVLLSSFSSNPDVAKAGEFVFRNYPSDALKTVAMAKYFKDEAWPRAAVITTNADFSVGFLNSLTKDVGEEGIVFSETVDPETKDFRSVLTRLKDVEFDVFVANTHQPAAMGVLVQQFREQGFTQPIVSHDVADDKTVWEAAGDAAEGMQIINVASLESTSDFGEKFLAKHEIQSGLSVAGFAYDAMHVLAQALEGAADSTAVRDALYAMEDYDGVVGTFGFDDNGDVTGVGFALKEVKDGVSKDVSPIEL